VKEKFNRFMQGRYGVDQFTKFLLVIGFIVILLSNLKGGGFLYLIGLLMLGFAYLRLFSRNHVKRYKENQRYLYYVGYIMNIFRKDKNTTQKNKNYHIYTCPSCMQKIRIPRGKGKIEISCPKCHTKFIKKC